MVLLEPYRPSRFAEFVWILLPVNLVDTEGLEPYLAACKAAALPVELPTHFKLGRGETARTSSALKLLFPKQVGYHLPIYTPNRGRESPLRADSSRWGCRDVAESIHF